MRFSPEVEKYRFREGPYGSAPNVEAAERGYPAAAERHRREQRLGGAEVKRERKQENIESARLRKVVHTLSRAKCDNFAVIGYGRVRFTFAGRPRKFFPAVSAEQAQDFLEITKDME